MRRRTTAGLAAAVLLASSGLAQAAAPALGTREGELLCAGLMNVMASGALLSTGARDAAAAIKAHGVFLGRLSVIAPDARYRLKDFFEVYDKMAPAEQDALSAACFAKLREIDPAGFGSGGPEPKVK